MLSFRRRLQQVCPQSLVLPSLDLTRLLELLLDLQLLRLCSGWTEGKWGQGRGRGRGGRGRTGGGTGGGGTIRGEGEKREREEETETETGRGRETENMLDRGGGGNCIQTDMERWDCVERDQEDSQWARDAKKTRFREHVQSWVENTRNSRRVHGQGTGIFRVLRAYKKL